MIASDNDLSSGAFLSMVTLCRLLRDEHGVDILVIVPRRGDGTRLLDEAHLPWRMMRSYSWIVPQHEYGLRSSIQMAVKRCLNLCAINRLTYLARERDIVHINTTYSYVGAEAARRAGIKLIWHLREFLEEDQGKRLYNHAWAKCVMQRADRIIAISGALHDKYADCFPNGQLVTILNGIDPIAFPPRRRPILQDDRVVLIYGGGYNERKGWRDLFKAISKLLTEGKHNFVLRLLGCLNQEAEAALTQMGLSAVTEQLGYQQDVGRYLREADIAFNCSQCEAFGRKTVEAMMSGCLVIAAQTGGTLDIIQDGVTGLYYSQGDAGALTQTIDRALTDPAASRQIASNGSDYAREHLTARTNADSIFCLYQTLESE